MTEEEKDMYWQKAIKRNGESIRISFTAEFDEILDILKEIIMTDNVMIFALIA